MSPSVKNIEAVVFFVIQRLLTSQNIHDDLDVPSSPSPITALFAQSGLYTRATMCVLFSFCTLET